MRNLTSHTLVGSTDALPRKIERSPASLTVYTCVYQVPKYMKIFHTQILLHLRVSQYDTDRVCTVGLGMLRRRCPTQNGENPIHSTKS